MTPEVYRKYLMVQHLMKLADANQQFVHIIARKPNE